MSDVTPSTHPNLDRLVAFVLGRLGPAETAAIQAHLEACPVCRTILETREPETLASPQAASATPAGAANPHDAPTAAPRADVLAGVPGIPPELADHPRYRVLALLGIGGMGAVFKAQHRLMERLVALKVVSRELIANPSAVERFRQEVRAAARLNHPNIVTAHDAEQAGDAHFLVMEFVEGTDLGRVLQRRGKLPIAHACEYVRQAALGLQHAHEQGMVHRDIKPQNLMLTPKGRIKILDFGLARFVSESGKGSTLTALGAVMGTPDYIAPEQADDARKADIRADIYSLGCTLYALLAGRPPFGDGTSLQKILAHVEREPPPVTGLRPDVPPELAEVLGRMLAKAPADRYQTPAEVGRALAPIVKGVSARPKAEDKAPAGEHRAVPKNQYVEDLPDFEIIETPTPAPRPRPERLRDERPYFDRPRSRRRVPDIRKSAERRFWPIVAGVAALALALSCVLGAVVFRSARQGMMAEFEWKEFAPPGGGFRVEVPQQPTQEGGKPVGLVWYGHDEIGRKYEVGYRDLAEGDLQRLQGPKLLEAMREELYVKNPGSKIILPAQALVLDDNVPGGEMKVRLRDNQLIWQREFLSGRRHYVIRVTIDLQRADSLNDKRSLDDKRFMESFRLVPR